MKMNQNSPSTDLGPLGADLYTARVNPTIMNQSCVSHLPILFQLVIYMYIYEPGIYKESDLHHLWYHT